MLLNHQTLSVLAAVQQNKKVFSFALGEAARRLERLRKIHAKRVAEINAYSDLTEETVPGLVLRAADGRELMLHLSAVEMKDLCCTLHEKLTNAIRELEEIVEEALEAMRNGDEPDPSDPRPAILALCQPTTPAVIE